jgi:hypothetical protein
MVRRSAITASVDATLSTPCAGGAIAVAEEEVRHASGEQRQPVRNDAVEQGCRERVAAGHAGDSERPDEASLDEAEPAGREGQQCQELPT